jgi:NTE family protein
MDKKTMVTGSLIVALFSQATHAALAQAQSVSPPAATEIVEKCEPCKVELVPPYPNAVPLKEFHLPPTGHRPTVALVLSGGGVRGDAHIGVLKAFQDAGIPIDYILGTSMGAIVGGMYAAGVPLPHIARIMEDGSLARAYLGRWSPGGFLLSPLATASQLLTKKTYPGLVNGEKYIKFLDDQLPNGSRTTFRDTKIPFGAIATNLVDGKEYNINEGQLARAIAASSAISPIITPIEIGDKLYVDSGLKLNFAPQAAKYVNADVVIGVLVDHPVPKRSKQYFQKLTHIAVRLTNSAIMMNDLKQLPWVNVFIFPELGDTKMFSRNPLYVSEAIAAGERAGRQAVPQIRALLNMPPSSVASGSEPSQVSR